MLRASTINMTLRVRKPKARWQAICEPLLQISGQLHIQHTVSHGQPEGQASRHFDSASEFDVKSLYHTSPDAFYCKILCVPQNWVFQHATRILDVIMLEYPRLCGLGIFSTIPKKMGDHMPRTAL